MTSSDPTAWICELQTEELAILIAVMGESHADHPGACVYDEAVREMQARAPEDVDAADFATNGIGQTLHFAAVEVARRQADGSLWRNET